MKGFSLIELIVTLVLIAVLAITVVPRGLSSVGVDEVTSRDQLVSVFRLLQHQRMQRTTSLCNAVSISNTVIKPDISVGCTNVAADSPFQWQAAEGLTLAVVNLVNNDPYTLPLSLVFSPLGKPSNFVSGIKLSLSSSSQTLYVCIEPEGYIHPCD